MVDGIGTTNYTYDNANRLTQVEGPYKTVSYGYDNGGRRTSLGLSGQNNVSYSYNAADYLTSLTNANNETTSWTYNDVGAPTRQDNANSTYAEWTYDANRYWITDVHNKKSDASTISRFQYTRDSVGDPTAMTETNGTLGAQSPWSYTFTYDNVYQLTGETKKDKDQNTVYTISYEYDAAGNRTKKTEDGNVTDYTYDDFNKMTAAGSVTFAYDNNGNMTSKTENSATTTYSYDYAGRMTSITYPDQSTNSFGYYASGHRAWKTDTSGTTRFVYDSYAAGSALLAELDAQSAYVAVYTHGPAGLISQRRSGSSYWYALDAVGCARNLTNSSQQVTDAYSYKWFGEVAQTVGSTVNPLKWRAARSTYLDSESGFLFAGGVVGDPALPGEANGRKGFSSNESYAAQVQQCLPALKGLSKADKEAIKKCLDENGLDLEKLAKCLASRLGTDKAISFLCCVQIASGDATFVGADPCSKRNLADDPDGSACQLCCEYKYCKCQLHAYLTVQDPLALATALADCYTDWDKCDIDCAEVAATPARPGGRLYVRLPLPHRCPASGAVIEQ